MIEPVMLIFFGLQSVIFAAWVVLSVAILIGMALRAVSRRETGSAADVGANAMESYLRDPLTRFRRLLWLGLTAALVVCGVVTVVILMTM